MKSLTTEVGSRLAGTKAEAELELGCCKIQRARIFKHTNRTTFADHWERRHEHVQILSPFPQNLVVSTLGGSISTPSGGIAGV